MELAAYLPQKFQGTIDAGIVAGAEEIRLRAGQPLEVVMGDEKVRRYGTITQQQIRECLNYLTGYSGYLLEEEMRQGFFTIEGGHRVGISGHTSYHRNELGATTDSINSIGAINIRVAHEQRGCARDIIPWMRRGEGWYHTICFSGPGIGKTTCLRDCIRILSSGEGLQRGYKVGVVDERSEIAACHMGIPQNELGPRCDVLDNCPKSIGMRMMLRSMSPEFLAVDELGGREDFEAVREAARCGVYVIGTVHAGSVQELIEKYEMGQGWMDRNQLRLVGISRSGERRQFHVYDGRGALLWES